MITSTRTLACLAVAVALLLGASRAAEFPIGGGNHLHQTNTLGNLAPEMNDSAGNMTEIAEGHLGDDINVDISNVDIGNSIRRRSLLDGGIPLTVEGSDT